MNVRVKVFRIKNELQVLWRENRWPLLWLFVCVLAGIVVGCVVISNPLTTYSKINISLIDANINNAISTTASLGNFLFGRFLDTVLGLLFVFIICLNSWTALLCFPYLAFRGFFMVINFYWIAARFGIAAGGLLLLSYIIFLTAVVAGFACAVLFIMRRCAEIRRNGMRCLDWKYFVRTVLTWIFLFLAIAFLEWLVYAVLLSKMVFII